MVAIWSPNAPDCPASSSLPSQAEPGHNPLSRPSLVTVRFDEHPRHLHRRPRTPTKMSGLILRQWTSCGSPLGEEFVLSLLVSATTIGFFRIPDTDRPHRRLTWGTDVYGQ